MLRQPGLSAFFHGALAAIVPLTPEPDLALAL